VEVDVEKEEAAVAEAEKVGEKRKPKQGRVIVPDFGAELVVGGEDGAFIGRIDDLKIAGIISGSRQVLHEDVDLVGKLTKIRFRDGKLDPAYHRGPVTIVLRYEGAETPITIGTQGSVLEK
jgi:hypothetical protein